MAGNLAAELNSVSGASYSDIFAKFRQLSVQYGDLPVSSLISAYNAANGPLGMRSFYTPNPYTQNRRVKAISTHPAEYTKEEVAEFVSNPETSEKPLRAIERSLEYSAYPLKHTRMVYQNLLTYHSYVSPSLTDDGDAKDDGFWREWKLLEKLRKKLNPKDSCHMICGQALQEGKVFYTPRVSVDKSHNKVEHAFLQQLPSDWVKIVGFNNVSKYTVAFDLMYFTQYGTDWRQFGDLFEPYIGDWLGSLMPQPKVRGKNIVYASKTGVDMSVVRAAENDNTDAYYQNGRWFYWVTLPVDRVFTFEIDDTDRNVLPVFTGMFIDLVNLSQMEQIQLELLQNPLVSILHGEMETWDDKNDNSSDQYKVSDAGRRMFVALFYQMLTENSTSGIGFFPAPFKNMKLESLSEVPNATEIVAQGVEDISVKSGLAAIIPATSDARAGAVQVSLMIESQMPKAIYRCYERLFNCLIDKLNLNYSFEFSMFGDLSADKDMEDDLRNAMTLGILPAIIKYNALHDSCLLDDIAISDVVMASKIMNKRLPLVSSYSAKQSESGLPPQPGRPQSEGVTSDGQEQDIDSQG